MARADFTDTLFDLSGRTALVTGGSRGIGNAIARRLAQHGARVAICGRDGDAVQAAAAAIVQAGGQGAIGLACNVTREQEITELVDQVEAAFGVVDILVANAGLHIHVGPSAQMSDAVLEKTFDGNFRSLHRLTQRLLPAMLAQGWGRIIAIGSISAHFGTGVYHSYTLSKALLMQYVRNIAVEHGAAGIRANTISPGLVRTDMARGLIGNSAELSRELERSTVGRMGEPDEIAGMAVALASAAGNYVNGQTIAVDGGQSIRYVA